MLKLMHMNMATGRPQLLTARSSLAFAESPRRLLLSTNCCPNYCRWFEWEQSTEIIISRWVLWSPNFRL